MLNILSDICLIFFTQFCHYIFKKCFSLTFYRFIFIQKEQSLLRLQPQRVTQLCQRNERVRQGLCKSVLGYFSNVFHRVLV